MTSQRTAVAARLAELRRRLAAEGAAACLSVDPDNQTYLAGFRALVYSRPILLLVDAERSTLIVPELEQEHARGRAAVDEVRSYRERPGDAATAPLPLLAALLDGLPEGAAIAVEGERIPLALAEEIQRRGHRLAPFDGVLRRQRVVKDATELAAIRAAGELVGVGVAASLAACRPGVSELAAEAAGNGAILERAAALGPDTTVELFGMTPSGAHRTTLPHVFSTGRPIAPGDVIIHTRQVALDGYRAELERTLLVGEPSAEQARAFTTIYDAQQAAIAAVAPGVPARAVDAAARAVIERAGYGDFAIHRSGHGIGVSVHEHPHLRFDNDEPLEPGMAITVEPGIYVPGLGGFRHSDTLVVTDAGSELVTEHPRSLEAMTIEVDA